MVMMKILLILFIFNFSIESFSKEGVSCPSLFETSSEISEKQLNQAVDELFRLRLDALLSKNDKETLIHRIEFNNKVSEIEKYLSLTAIKEKFLKRSLLSAKLDVDEKEMTTDPRSELSMWLVPPHLKLTTEITQMNLTGFDLRGDLALLIINSNSIVMDTNTTKEIFNTPIVAPYIINQAGFTGLDNIIYTINSGQRFKLYDIKSKTEISMPQELEHVAKVIRFSKDNKYIALKKTGRSAFLYDMDKNKFLSIPGDDIADVEFSSDGKSLIVLENIDRAIHVVQYDMNLQFKRNITTLPKTWKPTAKIQFSKDDKTFLVDGDVVTKVDFATGKKIATYASTFETAYAFSPDQKYIYELDLNTLRIIDFKSKSVIHEIKNDKTLTFNKIIVNDTHLITSTGGNDKGWFLRVWEWQ
jgi:WD40 repeat protein